MITKNICLLIRLLILLIIHRFEPLIVLRITYMNVCGEVLEP